MVSGIPVSIRGEAICLRCGGCGQSLDVQWASGQARSPQRQPATDLPVLSADSVSQGPPPQSKRPSKPGSANTQGGETGKMFGLESNLIVALIGTAIFFFSQQIRELVKVD